MYGHRKRLLLLLLLFRLIPHHILNYGIQIIHVRGERQPFLHLKFVLFPHKPDILPEGLRKWIPLFFSCQLQDSEWCKPNQFGSCFIFFQFVYFLKYCDLFPVPFFISIKSIRIIPPISRRLICLPFPPQQEDSFLAQYLLSPVFQKISLYSHQ